MAQRRTPLVWKGDVPWVYLYSKIQHQDAMAHDAAIWIGPKAHVATFGMDEYRCFAAACTVKLVDDPSLSARPTDVKESWTQAGDIKELWRILDRWDIPAVRRDQDLLLVRPPASANVDTHR